MKEGPPTPRQGKEIEGTEMEDDLSLSPDPNDFVYPFCSDEKG